MCMQVACGTSFVSLSLPLPFCLSLASFSPSPFILSLLNCSPSSLRSGYIQLTRPARIPVSCDGSLYHRFAPHVRTHGRSYKEISSIPSPFAFLNRSIRFPFSISALNFSSLLPSRLGPWDPGPRLPVLFYRKSKRDCKIKSILRCICVATHSL